jgi:hypothetical protein
MRKNWVHNRNASNRPISERFWEKVDIRGPDDCWNWLAGINQSGYGLFGLTNKSERAHRVAWMLTNGDIPGGLYICHHCDNRLCCNPAHCFLGTHDDNMKDMVQKGRANHLGFPGSYNGRARLTEKQVLEIRDIRQKGMILTEIAKLYKVGFSTIENICLRKTWIHI